MTGLSEEQAATTHHRSSRFTAQNSLHELSSPRKTKKMDPVQVLRLERDKLLKEQRRIQAEIDRLNAAIDILAGTLKESAKETAIGTDATGSVGSLPYGGWRELVLRLIGKQGRFVRARTIVDDAIAALPKQDHDKVKGAVRNALFGMRGTKVVIYRTGLGNTSVHWGLKDFLDPDTEKPRPGREPIDDGSLLDFDDNAR